MSDDLDWVALSGRRAKGKRPEFFDEPALDRLYSTVFALAAEVSALRERQDTIERLLDANGVLRRESGLRAEAAGGEGRQPRRLAILAFGTVLHPALQAAERLDASVADMRFAKPLDADLVLQLAASHDALVTVEEGCVMGGAGSAVLECLAAAGRAVPVLQLGIPDLFTEHGDPAKILSMCGLDAAGIEQSILKRFGSRPTLAAVNG